MLKLYEVPRYTIVRCQDVDEGKPFKFHNIDGMYSYCTRIPSGEVFHLEAWSDVEIVDE